MEIRECYGDTGMLWRYGNVMEIRECYGDKEMLLSKP